MPTPRGPLRLRSIEIRDFRGIDHLNLALVDNAGQPLDTVVLSGDNGCGKTSVLEAMLLVLGQLRLLPDDAAPLGEQVRFGASEFHLGAEVEVSGAEADPPRRLQLVARDLEQPNGPFWETLARLDPQVEYFSARREPEALGESPAPRGARSAREARRLIELKRRLRNAFNRAARQARASRPLDSSIERIRSVWSFLYGDRDVLDIIATTNDEGSDDEIVLRDPRALPSDITSLAQARLLSPSRPDIPRMVPLDRLSSGQVALFAFAGPLVFRDRPPDIVLVDEPEQHMHVQWQRMLIDLLRMLAPDAQLILATHSEEILRSVPSHQRFLLVGDEDPRNPARGEGAR